MKFSSCTLFAVLLTVAVDGVRSVPLTGSFGSRSFARPLAQPVLSKSLSNFSVHDGTSSVPFWSEPYKQFSGQDVIPFLQHHEVDDLKLRDFKVRLAAADEVRK